MKCENIVVLQQPEILLHNISKITRKIFSGFVYPSLAYIKTATSKIPVKS